METYEATFEIDSRTDAYAVRRILEQTYDTIREESRSVREGTEDADDLLEAFRTLREAARGAETGRLTIVLERDGSVDADDST